MRKTSKLSPAVLLILIALAALASPAWGRSGRAAHHHSTRAKRSAHHLRAPRRGTHPRSPRHAKPAAGHHATAPAPTEPKRTREKPEREQPSSAGDDAAVIASVLATPCENTEVTPEAANIQLVREAVMCLINRERAEHALPPLTVNPQLQAAAEEHDAEMLQLDYFAHVAPDGETPVQRIERTGYIANESEGYVIGENLAWGTYSLSTPKAIVEAWIASPGHLANILESRYTETGIGVVAAVPASLGEGNPGALYAQEFGVILK